MWDDLMENDPEMIKFREKWRAEGRAEGLAQWRAGEIAKGEIEVLRKNILILVKAWFPPLEEQAQQKVVRMRSSKNLLHLFEQLVSAVDEETARTLLTKNK
jgi:hypothetical protein